jgi:GNAT superfamily N-acetyltransferase
MLELKCTSLPLHSLAQHPAYSPLILPNIQSQLTFVEPATDWIAIEAHWHDQLVGLALTKIFRYNRMAQLYSLVVHENYRHQGIGRQLFAFLQHHLIRQENVIALGFEYEQTSPSALALEKIVASQGWLAPKVYLIRCYFTLALFNPSWLYQAYRPSPSLSFFPWKELRPYEKEQILFMASQSRFISYLSPLRQDSLIDPETSVGLRTPHQVVGWSITHRLDPQTLRYSILYVDSSLLLSGCGIQLLAESIKRQKQLPLPYALFEVNLKEIDPSWKRFVKKRLIPLAQRIESMKWATQVFV